MACAGQSLPLQLQADNARKRRRQVNCNHCKLSAIADTDRAGNITGAAFKKLLDVGWAFADMHGKRAVQCPQCCRDALKK